MAAKRNSTPPELKDFQISASWVPSTPAKPNSTTQQPICENWQLNNPSQAHWVEPQQYTPPLNQFFQPGDSVQKTLFMGGSNNYAANVSVLEENLSNFDTWQAGTAPSCHVYGDVMRTDKWTNLSFQNLLALADGGANKAVANALTDNSFLATSSFCAQTESSRLESVVGYADLVGASSSSSASRFHPQFDTSSSSSAQRFHPQFGGSQCTVSYGNARLHGPVNLLGATFDADLDRASVITDGRSIPSRHFFDLNSSPRAIDAVLSKSTSFQFEPITPQKTNKAEYQRERESPVKNLSKNDVPTANKINTDGSHLIVDRLSAATSKQLQENHKPDKGGGTDEADLTKTPQLKARRKKHRPKVVIEGQKPRGRKPSVPQETTGAKKRNVQRKGVTNHSGGENNGTDSNKKESSSTDTPKRKYVRKKGIDKSEDKVDKEESTKTTEVNAPCRTRSSCRRSLNFDSDSQVRNESSSRCPSSNCEAENVGAQDQSKIVQCKENLPSPLLSTVGPVKERAVLGDQIACTRGRCQIVFSDVTHDKEMNTVHVRMNTDDQRTTKSQSDSIACSTPERQVRGLKRQTMGTAAESEICNGNETGIFYNSMQVYLPMLSQIADKSNGTPGLHFPTNCKKKRTEKGYGASASSSQCTVLRDCWTNQITSVTKQGSSGAHYQLTNLLTTVGATGGTQNGRQIFEDLSALGPRERIRKKRSKVPTRLRNLASLLEICRELPASTSRMKGVEVLHEPPTCMEALVAETRSTMTTKKRSKRSMLINPTVQNLFNHQMSASTSRGPPLALTWRTVSPVDSIVEQLNQLDLNAKYNQESAEKQKALMAYRTHLQEQHALVPFQRYGAVIPFDSSFDQIRRRRSRPKVDLDDETTRVWKLLLENINNEGIDGTDEEKTKWWEEERRVFNGRADSFIARMHLVQGDRRFSPWKGSVVDSVVGVFLTQNVSDHLSSSAFMSLAARFSLVSKTQPAEIHEEKLGTRDIRVLDPDGTLLLNDDVLNQSVCGTDTKMNQDFEGHSIREMNRVNTYGSSFDGFSQTDKLGGQSPQKTVMSSAATSKSVSLIEDGKDEKDALSSQTSEISSQNSSDSPIAQTTERSDSCLLSTSEEATDGIKPNRCNNSTSFVKLLQMAGTVLHGVYEEGSAKKGSAENEFFSADISEFSSECASGTTFQKISDSFEAEPKFSSTDATSNNNYQAEINQKIVENEPVQIPGQSLFQENCKMQEASKSPTHPQNLMDVTGSSSNIGISENSEHKEVNSDKQDTINQHGKKVDEAKSKGGKPKKEKAKQVDWDQLRKQTPGGGTERARTANTMDSVDWDAVRCADVNEIAQTIKERGMNNMLAERIKDFLNRIVRDHGSIDLEWLRDVPPDKAKEYLLSIRGLGLKSVECVRLLTLHHLAFPVDTNVGRIAVRLGWVPLQPLPESLQLHLLELYPVLESIQKYLWPRLCKLDQRTLYELHYQMITFGKVFCTKSKPNCNACPMRGECRHFASAFASARLALPAPEEKSIVHASQNRTSDQNPMRSVNTLQLPSPESNQMNAESGVSTSQPIIEEPPSPEPIIEVPSTPEAVHTEVQEVQQCDIENAFDEDPDEIPTIQLNMEEFTHNLQKIMNQELHEGDMSKALVALTSQSASIPVPKLKNVSRLRTEHQVYELPDSHPLLEGLDKREPDDPCPYLLAIWTPGETADSIEPPERRCSSEELEKLCTDDTCSSCNSMREANSQTVRGTLLIPCRTAMRGSFPLNGTYFQVNEVFSDHESSLSPVDVPRKWLWNLPRRTVYFGTSIPTIFKGLSTEGIQYCFWRGFVCVRGFDRKTRAPRPLIARLHFPASRLAKGKGKADENET